MKVSSDTTVATALFLGQVNAWLDVHEVPLYGLSPPGYSTHMSQVNNPIATKSDRNPAEGNGKTSAAWATVHAKAEAFVSQLELKEKVNITFGYTGSVSRLGFKGLCFEDAPAVIPGLDFISAVPAGSYLCQTWDREYIYAYGLW